MTTATHNNNTTISNEAFAQDEISATQNVDWTVTDGDLQNRVSMTEPTNQC
jgi:hypothetical protein